MRQIISVNPSNLSVTPGGQLSFDVVYNADPQENLSGLGLRLHFNSNDLTFDPASIDTYSDFDAAITVAPEVQFDTSDLDNDPNTDSFILTAWGNLGNTFPGDGNLPDAVLYTPAFTAAEDFISTTINFSESDKAEGFQLDASSITVEQKLAPVFDSDVTEFDVAENSTSVTTVAATDGNNETLTYSINGGTDQDLFSIDEQTGALSFKAAPDFENPTDADTNGKYQVQVAVSDGTDSVSKDLTVTVTDVNEKPVFDSDITEFDATENKTSVTTVAATDEDGDTLTYSINGGADQDLFSINEQTGALSFKVAPDFENPTDADTNGKYQVQVAVSDGTTDSVSKDLIVTVIDETPVAMPELENGMVYNANSAGNNDITTTLSDNVLDLGTDADFDNLVGFYEVTGENGGIDTDGDGVDDLLPGVDNGYAQAALANAIPGWQIRAGSKGDPDKNTTVEQFGDLIIAGGKMYAPFVIANGGAVGIDGFIEAETSEGDAFNEAATNVDDLVAYFAYQGANPDGASHIQARDNNTFGFEDLPANLDGVSDNDFNDAVFKFDFSS